MRLRLSALAEKMKASLFLVPMASVVAAIAFGQMSVYVDSRLDRGSADLAFGLSSTVDSARAVLTTIAGATITFAGIAFSVSLLIIQLGSSQYSPRVVHTLFRDPFNRRVMGLVVGTFTYCLIVLRSVRSALEESGSPVIPNLSVAIAVLLGIAAILAIVAFINHSAHSMDISEILERVTRDAIDQIRSQWLLDDPGEPGHEAPWSAPTHEVRFRRTGWVQQVDLDALLEAAPDGGTILLDTLPGRYAIVGVPACRISPPPDDVEASERRIWAAIGIGQTRTMQQDISYGLRQLVDVALKALSPGINDPTTAQDAIFHAAAVLGEALRRNPPPAALTGDGDRRLFLCQQHTHDELVRLTFDEVRQAAAALPVVCVYLLEALELLHLSVVAAGLHDRSDVLAEQARLVLAGCEAADLLPHDLAVVRDAYEKRFGGPVRPAPEAAAPS